MSLYKVNLPCCREKYEEEVNEVRVQLHFHWNFHYIDGALSSLLGHLQPVELSIDRRKTLNDLYTCAPA